MGDPKDYGANTVGQDFRDLMTNPKSSAKTMFGNAFKNDPEAYIQGIKSSLYNLRAAPDSFYRDLLDEFAGSDEVAKIIPILRKRIEIMADGDFYDDINALIIAQKGEKPDGAEGYLEFNTQLYRIYTPNYLKILITPFLLLKRLKILPLTGLYN